MDSKTTQNGKKAFNRKHAVAIVFTYAILVSVIIFLVLKDRGVWQCALNEPPAPAAPAVSAPVTVTAPIVTTPPEPPKPLNDEDIVYDLYIMSLCPFGFNGLAELMDITRAFPKRQWNVWFLGRVEGGRISSMRGEPEIYDETLWLGVKALYPDRYHEFLKRRAQPKPSTEELLRDMKFDFGKIRRWADEKGRDELRQHYVRSQRVGVNASPTLFINGTRYDGGHIIWGRFVRSECRAADPMPEFCKEYSECHDDSDCVMKGKLGRCLKPENARATCEYRDDVPFTLTVLVADTAMDTPEQVTIDRIEGTLPGARLNIVKFSSDEGRQLMAQHNPSALPFFHLEKAAERAFRFGAMRATLEDADGGFRLRKGAVRENFFPQRREKPGTVELYADPLAPNIGAVINVVRSNPELAKRVVMRPIIIKDPREQDTSAANRLRAEEALRWLVLADEFKQSFHPYLERYASNPASSYWFNWLKPIRVNQANFLRQIDANRDRAGAHWEDLAGVLSNEPMMVMINNRTKVTVPNEHELERILLDAIRF